MYSGAVRAPLIGPPQAPPAFLQLAGNPLRWRLLCVLAQSDRTVSELTDQVGEPQNLVSYHLGKLRKAGVVAARRSSADRRDAYYSLDLVGTRTMVSAIGGALHPALGMAAPQPSDANPDVPMRVLFMCTGNSARSQIAEAFMRVRSAGQVEAHSAGTRPKPLHPNAVRVMRREHHIELHGQRSKHVSDLAELRFDVVITLCDRVREVCPELPGHPEAVHWSIADPSEGHGDDDEASYPVFVKTADELDTRVGFLLAALATPATVHDPIPRRTHDRTR